jgi:LytR cell envelope-related transcriptional attenuator
MSMLTPLGAGGQSRRPRRWLRMIVVVALLVAVVAVSFGAWRWWQQRDDWASSPAAPNPTCRTPSPKTPRPLPEAGEVTVAVANGTERPGLALDTADALASRGFVISDIGNSSKPIREGVALVRYTRAQLASAIAVASYMPGSALAQVRRVPDATVAVWLGPQFDGVVSTADADPGSVRLPAAAPICRTPPTDSS